MRPDAKDPDLIPIVIIAGFGAIALASIIGFAIVVATLPERPVVDCLDVKVK